jgi:DNA processing protein
VNSAMSHSVLRWYADRNGKVWRVGRGFDTTFSMKAMAQSVQEPMQKSFFDMPAVKKKSEERREVDLDPAFLQEYLSQHQAYLLSERAVAERLKEAAIDYPLIFAKGEESILRKRCVSVVGTRNPTQEGKLRAARVARTLVDLGFVVMSGLAKGVDTVAHTAALESGGLTAAVMGTPIHKIYPAANKGLAERIATHGVLISPAKPHEEKGRYLFPRRNRLMALFSEATIIIEAGETSGVVHQAAECTRQNRKLILLKSLLDEQGPSWAKSFLENGADVAAAPEDLKVILGS